MLAIGDSGLSVKKDTDVYHWGELAKGRERHVINALIISMK